MTGLVRSLGTHKGAVPPGSINDRIPSAQQLAFQKLKQTTQDLTQSDAAVADIDSINRLADITNTSNSIGLPAQEVHCLCEAIKTSMIITADLQNSLASLRRVAECSVIALLRSLGNRHPVRNLLTHFDEEIRDIIRKVLISTPDQDVLWRVAEECYK